MKNKLLTTLGICRKAGKLVMGFDSVMDAAKQGNLSLMILTQDLSQKTAKEADYMADKYNIQRCRPPILMDDIRPVLGKRCGVLGVLDPGLADTVNRTAGRLNEEESIL